ncbi:hypothetical protein ACHWQZ_G015812 [Mnemiopsis leidyi]
MLDVVKMISNLFDRYLLSNTKLKIKIEKTVSDEFIVSIGAFQRDSLSDQLLPLEWEYADDVDFLDEYEENLQALLPVCKEILQEWNLYVNESKTEFTTFYIAGKNDRDEKGECGVPRIQESMGARKADPSQHSS